MLLRCATACPRGVALRPALLILSTTTTPSVVPFARALSSRSSGQTDASAAFRTVVPVESLRRPPSRLLTYSDPLFFIGSCFSDNVGGIAESSKLLSLRNPFGVQYNGSSIARCLRRIADGEAYRREELGCHPSSGSWHSLDHHSRYNGCDAEAVLESINADLFAAREFLATCRQAYVTLGSAYVFDAVDPSLRPLKAVANCHKLPPRMFEHRIQTVDEIRDSLISSAESIRDLSPDASVTFTVSPVRHWKDGPTNNARSKAHLLAAVHEAVEVTNSRQQQQCGGDDAMTDYFPSYEIVLDELRDYRFFDKDMLHPSRVAVEYVWERLLDAHFDRTKVDGTMARVQAVARARAHRPFDPEGGEYRDFLRRQLEEMERLEREFGIDFAEEREDVRGRLGE